MKHITFSFSLFALLSAGLVFAQEGAIEANVEAVVEAETVTTADLEVSEPELLPTSPFYFFKEIGRGLQRALIFNAVSKAELELKIASEKAAEAKKVAEQNPDNERGISRALLNYERSQERLRARLERLRETSENPNIDRLLDKITRKQIVHEKLLEALEKKHEEQKSNIQSVRAKVLGALEEAAKKDSPEKFKERLDNAFEQGRGSTLKHVRFLEILERLQESEDMPAQTKEKLQELREKLTERASESVERFAKEGQEGADRLREALQRMPGNALKRSVILEEIRARASERAADVLDEARDSLDETIREGKDFEGEARLRIKAVEEGIVKIETRLQELGDKAPQAARALLDNAKKHLEEAKAALAEGNPRNAFGLSRAAEVMVRNIWRILERGADAAQEAPRVLERVKEGTELLKRPIRPMYPKPDDQPSSSAPCFYPGSIDLDVLRRECEAEGSVVIWIQQPRGCPEIPVCRQPVKPSPSPPPGVKELFTEPPTDTPLPMPLPPPASIAPAERAITIEADDYGFSPSEIRVRKGTKVILTFNVSRDNVYYAGLDFRSSKFNTPSVNRGESTVVEFAADESFEFKSYWPASGVLKATGRVIVE